MKTYDLEFVKLLPHFMRYDGSIIGLSKATDEIIGVFDKAARVMTTWDKINELPENELDDLAWELNITWYNKSAPIDVKRELILNSDKVYQKLGTKWAVENVISTYFGEGFISEWFEYDGEPGHFRIFSSNPTVTDENLTQFMDVLNKVKRASAHLDGVFITLTCRMPLSAGVALCEASFDTIRLGGKF